VQKKLNTKKKKHTGQELVKYVVVSLSWRLEDNSRLLEQVVIDLSATNSSARKQNFDELSKSRRVVVSKELKKRNEQQNGEKN
jgi:hypothetical protein